MRAFLEIFAGQSVVVFVAAPVVEQQASVRALPLWQDVLYREKLALASPVEELAVEELEALVAASVARHAAGLVAPVVELQVFALVAPVEELVVAELEALVAVARIFAFLRRNFFEFPDSV